MGHSKISIICEKSALSTLAQRFYRVVQLESRTEGHIRIQILHKMHYLKKEHGEMESLHNPRPCLENLSPVA